MVKKRVDDILSYGKKILQAEAEAINSLANSLDEAFDQSVRIILEMAKEGRVIVSGMGKAGFVGMKISATLASTGVPSFFLHPAEAVHGDLGRYTRQDLALILSNSGETQEILRIVPMLKQIGCPLISITNSKESSLAKHSDVAISIGKHVEAGPLGLAPTTSATVMLALGDALAMSVLKCRDFSPEKYAFYHPGGSLGRALMQVREIMRTDKKNCIVPQTMITKEVIQLYTATEGRPGAATIVDDNGKLAGIFTDGNLRRCLAKDVSFLDQPISTVMSIGPKTILPDKLVQEALRILSDNKIDQVVVVSEDNQPIGLVDIQDLVII